MRRDQNGDLCLFDEKGAVLVRDIEHNTEDYIKAVIDLRAKGIDVKIAVPHLFTHDGEHNIDFDASCRSFTADKRCRD